MSNQDQRLRDLYHRFMTNDLSADELNEFLLLMSDPSTEKPVEQLMDRTWSDIHSEEVEAPVIAMPRRNRFRLIASVAAAFAFLFFISYYFIKSNNKANPSTIAGSLPAKNTTSHDAAPGRNLAMLKLGNGQEIVLDSSSTGTLANEGSTKIIKLSSGQLSYSASATGNAAILYNTVSTPRGGQYQIELPDGSQVWLNAASSLHFPTSFKGAQRVVDLTGEGYFEVAKNKQMPFIVRVNGSEVKVLGTHFNINAYTDEPATKTTLLEGSVEVSKGQTRGMLVPGQQAQIAPNGQAMKIAAANIEEVVAWKNGYFQFSNSGIESVMKQISRWYDIDVVYDGQRPSGHFSGKIGRSSFLSEMLKVIEASGVHFKVEGKILRVES